MLWINIRILPLDIWRGIQEAMDQYTKKAIALALITAAISGFAVFINKFGVALWADSASYTTAKNIVAAIFLTGLVIGLKKLPELRRLPRTIWIKLVLIGFIGGSVPFLLFFKSLTMLPASEAAFIHKTLFLWVALFALPFLKERLSIVQFLALGVLFAGIFLSTTPNKWVLSTGIVFAFAATVLWAIENIIAKMVLKDISPIIVGWARMFLGSLFLLGYLAISGGLINLIPSSASQAGWAFLVGIVLFGYVVTWYSALKHAPATVVSSVLVIAAPITALLDAAFVSHSFPNNILVPLAFMVLGVALVSRLLEQYYAAIIPWHRTARA